MTRIRQNQDIDDILPGHTIGEPDTTKPISYFANMELLLKKELAELSQELKDEKQEREKSHNRLKQSYEEKAKYAKEDFVKDFIVFDSDFQRAIHYISANPETIISGINQISKKLDAFLTKNGIYRFGARGDLFDPQYHEVIAAEPSAEYDENVIIQVTEYGYRFNSRVIRPAHVIVSQGKLA